MTAILGPRHIGWSPARNFARAHDAASEALRLAQTYWRLAPDRGVRPEVAYAQMLKETGYGRFGGVVDASFHNPCGLKIARGGSNADPGAHARFPTWEVGVIAHLDHLALYAGSPGYPLHDTPDPRHFPFLLGDARTVEALGGKWAPAKGYGTSLARLVAAMVKS